jgi:hypothetical protein
MIIEQEEMTIATEIIRKMQSVNPKVGNYVASRKNYKTNGLVIKVDNAVIQIPWSLLEGLRKNLNAHDGEIKILAKQFRATE